MNDKSKHLIEKSNVLNGFVTDKKTGHIGLVEYRFFCTYLSRVNARDENTRDVTINIDEFSELFGSKVNLSRMVEEIDKHIFDRKVLIQEDGHNVYAHLYSKFEVDDEKQNVIVSANLDVMPYVFQLKSNYTKYHLENISHLNSVSKIRLYEILVQHKYSGTFKVSVEELKAMMISNNSTFSNFSQQVLIPAVKDINKYTDIDVSYKKVTKSRKVVAISFEITLKQNEISEETKEKTIENTKEITKEPRKKGEVIENPDIDRAKLREIAENLLDDDYRDNQIERFIDHCIEKSAIDSEVRNPTKYVMKVMSSCSDEWQSKHQATSYDISEVEKYAVNYEAFVRANKGITEPTTESKATTPTEPVEAITEPVVDEGERIYKEFIKDGYAEMLQMSFAEANIRLLMINPVWETIDNPNIEAIKKILEYKKIMESIQK